MLIAPSEQFMLDIVLVKNNADMRWHPIARDKQPLKDHRIIRVMRQFFV